MTHSSEFELEACNETELYQICRDAQIPVTPRATKQQMILYLLGEEEPPPLTHHEIDTWRRGIMAFLLDHWSTVRAQLECPAKSGDPLSCFQCVDAQVVSCVVQNASSERLIQIHRK
jgi:hypothetical protein